MLIIFGWGRQFRKLIGITFIENCWFCGQEASVGIIRVMTFFTLFFIPVFPYKTEYYVACEKCGDIQRLTVKQYNSIKTNAISIQDLKKLSTQSDQPQPLTVKGALESAHDGSPVPLKVGETCKVTRDILVDGNVALYKGDTAVIKSVETNSENQEESSYILHCEFLDQDVSLNRAEVARALDVHTDTPKDTAPKKSSALDSGKEVGLPTNRERCARLRIQHRVLFGAGLVLLITGIILMTTIDRSVQELGGSLVGLAIVVAIFDVLVYRDYRRWVAKPGAEPAVRGLRVNKFAVALGVFGVFIAIAVAGNILAWTHRNNEKRNAYVAAASDLMAKRSGIIEEEQDASVSFGQEFNRLLATLDQGNVQDRFIALANKYIATYQSYNDRISEIGDAFEGMKPPTEYREFQDKYVSSCVSFCQGLGDMIASFGLFKHIDENIETEVTNAQTEIDHHLNEATDLSNQAEEAWPE